MAQLSDDLNNEFMDTFKMLDENDEGQISGSQLLLALKAHGIEPDGRLIERGQSSKPVSFQEYMSIIVAMTLSTDSWCRAEMQEAFDVFDKDLVGTINQHQIKRVLLRLGEKLTDSEIDQQYFQFDTNDDLQLEPKGFFKAVISNEDSTK
mmetsp:Transcript_5609/g.8541  ORF Transcript_5609/g.8541 Transcript_5609/m.8541 type:complete len:150 (+) Transcript_5609:52-501(+)